jgi:LysR family cyn operon transcriptional activator
LDLQKLRGFYWTAHLGSVSSAARRTHVSQSAVSHQLRALERELGAKLYRRTRRGIALTPEGELLLNYARDVIQSLDDLRAEFDDLRGRPRGTVRLAAFRGYTLYALPDIVQRFHALHPGVRLRIASKIRDQEILRLTAAGEVDVGITASWNEFPGLEYREHASYGIYACTAPDHPWAGRDEPLSLTELAGQPLLLYEQGTAFRDRIDRIFAGHGLQPEVAVEAGGSHAILEYVKRGLGVGIVSGLVLEGRDDPGLRAIPVTVLFGALGYGFVLRAGRYHSRAVRAFLEVAEAATATAAARTEDDEPEPEVTP